MLGLDGAELSKSLRLPWGGGATGAPIKYLF